VGPTSHLTHQPVGYLTAVVYYGWQNGGPDLQLGYDAAFMLVVLILALIVGARIIVALTQRHTEKN
jgi:ABC-type phosphate transport system permease subunit